MWLRRFGSKNPTETSTSGEKEGPSGVAGVYVRVGWATATPSPGPAVSPVDLYLEVTLVLRFLLSHRLSFSISSPVVKCPYTSRPATRPRDTLHGRYIYSKGERQGAAQGL